MSVQRIDIQKIGALFGRLIVGPAGAPGPFVFALLALMLGVLAGLGAFGFRVLIALVHNLAFLGQLSIEYNTLQHTLAAPWGLAVALVPVAGAVVVVFLVRHFAPEAGGEGVPEVMDAVYYQKSVIRPMVAAVKSVASAISIGTGGSVGREGPIIQIGASFGSLGASLARASRWQRATLVAAGGGAGIAATFNTPIGGLLFAVEILLHEVSARTLVPVALATAAATFVGRVLFGNTPAFPVPALASGGAGSFTALVASFALGCVMALVSAIFIRSVNRSKDLFENHIPGLYLRHVTGMFALGCIMSVLFAWRGHYYVEGVGYATIMDVLSGALTSVWFLVLLAVLKLIATCLTLGSGGSGGVFSPSLFMGATLGAAYGLGLHALFPDMAVDPRLFALAGMTALVAGATGAALTAVVMMFEMTLDYSVILPLTLAAATSYGLRRLILGESIYTIKLGRRGHAVPKALQANAYLVHHVSDIAMPGAVVLCADALPGSLPLDHDQGPSHFVIMQKGAVVGILAREWALAHRAQLDKARCVGEVARRDIVVVPPDTTVFELLTLMQKNRACAAVVGNTRASPLAQAADYGLVTKERLAEALAEGMELFED